MSPRIRSILAAAIAMIAWRAAMDPGTATVVRDGKSGPSNPAVAAGGHKLPNNRNDSRSPVVIQYNLIDASGGFYPWLTPNAAWPWGVFNSIYWNRHGPIAPRIGPWLNQTSAPPFRPPLR